MHIILNIPVCILFITSFANAQQQTENETLVVNQTSVTMTSGPGGGKMGELYINSPVVVEEIRGNWARVTLQTWIKKDGLAKSEVGSKTPTNTSKASSELVIEKFSIDKAREGVPKGRIYLTLKLKNNSPKKIQSWKALLVAQSGSEVLFREQLADNTKPMEVGGTTELDFYWTPREEPFKHLSDTSPEKLKLEFYQVVWE